MAENKKRILIDVINPGINCVYRLDNDPKGQSLCKHNGNMEPVTAIECRHCEEGMTRQEAIERINHAICVEVHGPCDICEQVRCGNEGHCNDYKKYAEAALDALLEEDK